jgi:hypothetical protein
MFFLNAVLVARASSFRPVRLAAEPLPMLSGPDLRPLATTARPVS